MIVIYGQRWYGRAFSHGPQGIATRGFHIYYVPLIPTGQMWLTERGDRMVRGMSTRWSWRAVMPVFAIQWAILGLILAGANPIAGVAVTAAAIAAGVWGYAGSHRSDARTRTAREITSAVLGTGCPPELLEPNIARDLASRLDTTWGKVSDRPPEDVASLGPRDRREGALAYTLFVVRASYESGARAKSLRAQADQVLDAMDRTPQLAEGAPYRAEVMMPEPQTEQTK